MMANVHPLGEPLAGPAIIAPQGDPSKAGGALSGGWQLRNSALLKVTEWPLSVRSPGNAQGSQDFPSQSA